MQIKHKPSPQKPVIIELSARFKLMAEGGQEHIYNVRTEFIGRFAHDDQAARSIFEWTKVIIENCKLVLPRPKN